MEHDELLNEAIMSETPIIVVEGPTDVPIYEKIGRSIGKGCEVIAVQNLKGMHEGNKSVIEFIKLLNEVDFSGDLQKYIIGVIDRDSRYFRGELVEIPGLFILKFYSMESHFITKEAVKCVLEQCTNTSSKLVNEDIINFIFCGIIDELMELYLVSLESLKNACVKNYTAVATYSMNVTQMRNIGSFNAVKEKEQILREFGDENGLSGSFISLLEICKGKWVFSEFSRLLLKRVKNLYNSCGVDIFERCQFCFNDKKDLCSYKLETSYDQSQVCNIIKSNEGFTEFNYLKERLVNMI